MTKQIKKIGVIGAGQMGGGIAAQAANAGIPSVLFDLKKEDADKSVARMRNARPDDAFNAGFMVPENAELIETATSPDDFAKLADCDLIIMSIVAPVPVRQKIFRQIHEVAKPDAIFSDNTSMDTVASITEGMPEDFRKRFLNTHFFNPVRPMHLLEIIPGKDTAPEIVDAASEWGSVTMGKKIVDCKDERGFIANRIGIMAIELVNKVCRELDMNIEDADAIMGEAFGFPQLGIYGLADEVGIDIVDYVRSNFHDDLPASDRFQKVYTGEDWMKKMLTDGYVGKRKADSKGGFYRIKKDADGNPVIGPNKKPLKESRDLKTGEYRDFKNSPYYKFEKQIKKYGGFDAFFDSDSKAAAFAWPVFRELMLYVFEHAETLANDVQSIDDAMRAGYNWEHGPFQLLDKFGVDWFTSKLENENIPVPALLQKAQGRPFYQQQGDRLKIRHFDGSFIDIKREPGMLILDDIKRTSKPIVTHKSASLWDIGDGVTCLEFHSEQNTIDPSTLYVVNESIKAINESNGKYKAMVVYNDNTRFSVGANLKLAEIFMNVADNKWAQRLGIARYAEKGLKGLLHELIYQGQAVYTALNQAPFPVIGAPKGQAPKSKTTVNLAVGGGCEILLNCDAIQAGPEEFMALPEIGIGILPAWTGTMRYLEKMQDLLKGKNGFMESVTEAMKVLADPARSLSLSSQDAQKKHWIGPEARISMNPDRVLGDAKELALSKVPGYAPKPLPTFRLPGAEGPNGRNAIRMDADRRYKKGEINHVDVMAADRLATVLSGGVTLKRDDVRRHAVAHHDRLEQIIDEREDGIMRIHPGIELNHNRILQLERDYILDAFRDKKNTWPRLRHLLETNNYLREKRLSPAPEPKELRASMVHEDLPRRDIDGKPLTGTNGETLKVMADMTSEFYKLYSKMPKDMSLPGMLKLAFSEVMSGGPLARQATRTLTAVRKTFARFDMS